MDEDTSFDYDEFSLDFNDPDLDSQLDSFTSTSTSIPIILPKKIVPLGGLKPPPPKQQQQSKQPQIISKQLPQIQSRRNVLPITRHSQAILRPALPPNKRNSTTTIAASNVASTSTSTNNYTNRKLNNPIVHPNPFQHKVIPIPKRQEMLDDSMDVSSTSFIEEETREEEISQVEEGEEEEMPIINVSGTGEFIRTDLPPSSSSTHTLARKVVMGKPSSSAMLPPPIPRVVVGLKNGSSTTSISKGKGVDRNQDHVSMSERGAKESTIALAGAKGLDSAERRELDELRAQKVMVCLPSATSTIPVDLPFLFHSIA